MTSNNNCSQITPIPSRLPRSCENASVRPLGNEDQISGHNDLDQRIIDAVIRLVPESQFKTAPEAGFHTGTSDSEVLRIAADDGRILVSHDLKTMPRHFGEFIERNISPGVIIIRQELAIRDAALWLQFFQEAGTPEDFVNIIRIVSQPF